MGPQRIDSTPLGKRLGFDWNLLEGPRDALRGASAGWLASLLVGLLMALPGCVCEDYFCDEFACYYCDGISCREADPPSRIQCRGDFDCPNGTVCTTLGCVDTCDPASEQPECPEGTVCRPGPDLCLGPGEETPDRNPGTCSSAADCPGSGLACIDGFCAADPNVCLNDRECSGNERCVSGRCESPDDLCQFTFECEAGRVCVNARCVEPCGTTGCPTGLVCDSDGFCKEDLSPGECVKSSDCAAGQICINTRCVDECVPGRAGDCTPDEYCDDGRCRFDDRPAPPFCTRNSDCAVGRVCVDGVCRTPCDTSMECLRFDVQFNVCLNNLCVTTNEATSDCETQLDCTAPDSCIDGICQ